MKKLFIIFISSFVAQYAFATTRLIAPGDVDIQELNTEEKDKLQNVQYQESVGIPTQYKGKLKNTEGKEEIHFKDLRLFLGVGGRYTFANNITLNSSLNSTSEYFNKKNQWKYDGNFNYFASLGVYWRNGIRIEFEYSQMTLETNNFASKFKPYNNGTIPFNQYLQTNATLQEVIELNGRYNRLIGNDIPLVELSVKTYMMNFIFEKSTAKSKIRPYVGFGLGLINGDMESLVNEGSSSVFGGQVLAGVSYPFAKGALVLYLGYRGIFSTDMEQTFTRITGVNGYNGNFFNENNYFYYNPVLERSAEKYKIMLHNVDLGIRFFF